MTGSWSKLIENTKHYDQDERYMATLDIIKKLDGLSPQESIDSKHEGLLCDSILLQLHDSSNEVKSMAVKCLSTLVKKVKPNKVQDICSQLSTSLLNGGNDTLDDIYAIGLKESLKSLDDDSGKKVSIDVCTNFSRALLSSVEKSGEIDSILQDVLAEAISLYIDSFESADKLRFLETLTNLLFSALQSGKSSENKDSFVIRKLVESLAKVATSLRDDQATEKLLKMICAFLVTSLQNSNNIQFSQIIAVDVIAKVSSSSSLAVSNLLTELLDLLLKLNEIDNNSTLDASDLKFGLSESILTAFSAFMHIVPKNFYRSIHFNSVIVASFDLLAFDPNYNYDPTEGNLIDFMNEETKCAYVNSLNSADYEMDRDCDEDDYSDVSDFEDEYEDEDDADDDSSWKVRKAAAHFLQISSSKKISGDVNKKIFSKLLERRIERDDNVRAEIVNAIKINSMQTDVVFSINQPENIYANLQDLLQVCFWLITTEGKRNKHLKSQIIASNLLEDLLSRTISLSRDSAEEIMHLRLPEMFAVFTEILTASVLSKQHEFLFGSIDSSLKQQRDHFVGSLLSCFSFMMSIAQRSKLKIDTLLLDSLSEFLVKANDVGTVAVTSKVLSLCAAKLETVLETGSEYSKDSVLRDIQIISLLGPKALNEEELLENYCSAVIGLLKYVASAFEDLSSIIGELITILKFFKLNASQNTLTSRSLTLLEAYTSLLESLCKMKSSVSTDALGLVVKDLYLVYGGSMVSRDWTLRKQAFLLGLWHTKLLNRKLGSQIEVTFLKDMIDVMTTFFCSQHKSTGITESALQLATEVVKLSKKQDENPLALKSLLMAATQCVIRRFDQIPSLGDSTVEKHILLFNSLCDEIGKTESCSLSAGQVISILHTLGSADTSLQVPESLGELTLYITSHNLDDYCFVQTLFLAILAKNLIKTDDSNALISASVTCIRNFMEKSSMENDETKLFWMALSTAFAITISSKPVPNLATRDEVWRILLLLSDKNSHEGNTASKNVIFKQLDNTCAYALSNIVINSDPKLLQTISESIGAKQPHFLYLIVSRCVPIWIGTHVLKGPKEIEDLLTLCITNLNADENTIHELAKSTALLVTSSPQTNFGFLLKLVSSNPTEKATLALMFLVLNLVTNKADFKSAQQLIRSTTSEIIILPKYSDATNSIALIFTELVGLLEANEVDSLFRNRQIIFSGLQFMIHNCPSLVVSNSHNFSAVLTDKNLRSLFKIGPVVFRDMFVKSDLKEKINLGPFSHVVDGGLPVRKSAFHLISSMLSLELEEFESLYQNYFPMNEFIVALQEGLSDVADVQMICHEVCILMAKKLPNLFLNSEASILVTKSMAKVYQKQKKNTASKATMDLISSIDSVKHSFSKELKKNERKFSNTELMTTLRSIQ